MKISKYQWGSPIEDWSSQWKDRLQPSARSKVLQKWNASGKKPKPESSTKYTKRRIKEETKRTWRSDAADIAHGIGEGALALHPYTAIPYYGAKVGQDVLNGNLNWETALNASIPLFHLSPQTVGLREATNVALEDAANAGSKTARNLRVAREIKQATRNKPNIEAPKPIIRTKVGDIEIDNPNLLYHLDRGNSVGAFSNQGAYVENGVLFPGVAKKEGQLGYSWWNKGKPYATSINGQPMTRLMTATKDTPGMLQVRSQNYPIGQWTGSKGFVLPSEYVNSEGVNVSGSVYNWKPGYGYKKVTQEPSTSLKFFVRKPARISEAERAGIPKGERNQPFKAKIPKITVDNATSITPEQWTAAQDAALAKGDIDEAQRLRDLHQSLTPTATSGKYYRGTKIKRNSYPDRHIDEEVGEMNGIYLTKKPKYAKTYGDVEEFYLRSNNPLETEGSWTGIIDDATRAEIENAGYDAIVNNRFDTGFLNKLLRNSRDETITFNGKNLKSADAVTYDDNGVRIPLGERDNFNINDIRYGLLPFGIGLTGYGLYKRK